MDHYLLQHDHQDLIENEANVEIELASPLMSKARILWNFYVLNCCCFVFYTGFGGLSNLQSTMNAADGIGPDSQAVIYGCSIISSLMLPDILIEKFGCKKVLIFSTLLSLPYMAANMHLHWELIFSTSVLYGLVSGPFNSASAIYIDELATRYQSLTSKDLDYILALFFGICFFFSEISLIIGNAIAFFVLRSKRPLDIQYHKIPCGMHFQNNENVTGSYLEPPTQHQRLVLISIYLILSTLSIFWMYLFLDPLKNDIGLVSGWKNVRNRFLAPIKHALNCHQILLVPISVYIGIENTLYLNEFTEAYIACSWGVHHVGFVTICFGVCGAIMSLLVGPLVKYISQMAVLILAACANIGICVLLFLWDPTPETTSIYFIIAGVWGMGDAIWWSQISALYGLMFPNDREAAFSNLYFWSFLGFFLSYSYANYLSVAVKINILMAFLLTGMACYLVGQIKIKCSARKEYIHIENGNQ
ncbi:protein unc-93 homolog A isoform X4 [Parasteatoda tepidariorum]|uniref:protein unc-93 homolog A isoform X4 n=1 Tax=Parasteatoda tepidariorum TaxID=114398 RepID=UPI001C7193D1|nr:protein unc-93 homolog A isoform X4 [Parasteatoda tepidariorum]